VYHFLVTFYCLNLIRNVSFSFYKIFVLKYHQEAKSGHVIYCIRHYVTSEHATCFTYPHMQYIYMYIYVSIRLDNMKNYH